MEHYRQESRKCSSLVFGRASWLARGLAPLLSDISSAKVYVRIVQLGGILEGT